MAITYKSKITYKDSFVSQEQPKQLEYSSISNAPANFGKELTNPNPDFMSNVLSGGNPMIRAGMATLQPIYDQMKGKIVEQPVPDFIKRTVPLAAAGDLFEKSLPEDKKWIAKGAKATGVDLLAGSAAGGIVEGVPKIPIRGLSLGERVSLPSGNNLLSKFINTPEEMASQAETRAIQARDKTMKLFPESMQEGTLEQRRNTAEQASKYIQKSKNYEDIANQMEMAKGISGGELGKVYESGVLSNSRTQHDPLLQYISELESSSLGKTQGGKNTIKKLRDLHTADVEKLNSTPVESLNDPNFYQKQKEMFQAEASRLGAYTDPESGAMAKGLQKMSQGYQGKVYAVDDAVKPLLSEQGSLMKSQKMAEEMAIKEASDLKPSFAQEAAGSISGSPVQTGARFVRKGILDRFLDNPAKRLTDPKFGKGIPKLMAESERAQALADAMTAMKTPERVPFSMNKPLQLEAPKPKGLPSPDDFRTRDIKGGRLLPGATGSGKTINVEGSSTINMPEVLDSDIQRLSKKFGVPERNVREIISQSDIQPVVKSSSTEGLITSKNRRSEINQIMSRRKANFQ